MSEEDKELRAYMMQRIDRIETKLDQLLAFKWQIIGGSVLLSFLGTIAFNVISFIFKQH